MGLVSIGLLLLGEKFLPGRPVALAVVALAIGAVSLAGLAQHGVAIVGELPAGLPDLAWPSLRLRDVDGVLPLAAACFLLGFVESVSAGRTLAAKHGYEINPRQELLALGVANLAAAFGQGFPIAGGLSQSAVNDKAGARTPLCAGVCLCHHRHLLGVLDKPTPRFADRDPGGDRASGREGPDRSFRPCALVACQSI